jgi:hypothetical protein
VPKYKVGDIYEYIDPIRGSFGETRLIIEITLLTFGIQKYEIKIVNCYSEELIGHEFDGPIDDTDSRTMLISEGFRP